MAILLFSWCHAVSLNGLQPKKCFFAVVRRKDITKFSIGQTFLGLFLTESTLKVFSDSEESPLTPLCIEDAERVEDPILLYEALLFCSCVDQAARTSGPLAWSFEQIASSKHISVSDAIAEQIPLKSGSEKTIKITSQMKKSILHYQSACCETNYCSYVFLVFILGLWTL